jgi:mannose-6-phosphate isomerase-like protein (cupin superfamily)
MAERLLGMRANREIIPPDPNHSVRWHEHDYPSPIARWNYHPEYEIHLIRKGTGKFIVGDHVGTFEAGQVSLVGSGLPHDWVSDLAPGEVLEKRDAVIQFDG